MIIKPCLIIIIVIVMTKSPFLPSGGSAVWTGTSCVWVSLRLPQHGLSARQVKPVLLLHGKQNLFLCLEKVKQKKDRRQDCVEQILLVFAVAKERFDTWNPLCIQTILTKPGSERLLHTAWTWKNRKSKWKKTLSFSPSYHYWPQKGN